MWGYNYGIIEGPRFKDHPTLTLNLTLTLYLVDDAVIYISPISLLTLTLTSSMMP